MSVGGRVGNNPGFSKEKTGPSGFIEVFFRGGLYYLIQIIL